MLLSLFNKPQASRKFIDLINGATSKWANWDPGNIIKVGDFGEVDKATGGFIVKGNIYDPETNIYLDQDPIIREMVERNPPIIGAQESDFYASSKNVVNVDHKLENHASIAGLAEASIKGQWTFSARRGAVLIMARPKSCYIPHGKLLEHLAKVEALKGMYLVTQVFICPTYGLYLSNSKNDVVCLALLESAPIPHAPGVTVGGEGALKWWSSNAAGLFRNGHEPNGKDHYAPLYNLQKIRIKDRSQRGVPDRIYTGDSLWVDAEVPWETLDEDGDEEVVGNADGDMD